MKIWMGDAVVSTVSWGLFVIGAYLSLILIH